MWPPGPPIGVDYGPADHAVGDVHQGGSAALGEATPETATVTGDGSAFLCGAESDRAGVIAGPGVVPTAEAVRRDPDVAHLAVAPLEAGGLCGGGASGELLPALTLDRAGRATIFHPLRLGQAAADDAKRPAFSVRLPVCLVLAGQCHVQSVAEWLVVSDLSGIIGHPGSGQSPGRGVAVGVAHGGSLIHRRVPTGTAASP